MGFDTLDLRFFLSARAFGFDGDSICTLGRLTLFATQSEINQILREHGRDPVRLPEHKGQYFVDDLLPLLGIRTVDSLDYSSFEGATIVHDLNQPIPTELHHRYDLVLDGGTLEHVFNFPTALWNAMKLLKVGGHLMIRTPANNQCGHGFYQFSPELFFSALSPENGFKLERIYITGKGGPYHVIDPATVHRRVELLSGDVAYLMVHAKKINNGPANLVSPQQSDYVETWEASTAIKPDVGLKSPARRLLSASQIAFISRMLNHWRQKLAVRRWRTGSNLGNRSFYIPVTRWDIPSSEAKHQN